MRIFKRTSALLSALAIAAVFGAPVYADEDINVRMNGIVSEGEDYVYFGDAVPFQIDSRILTPARYMAEGAGMSVDWDQRNQTAILTLNADAYSDKPIERYAAEVISKINGYGLELTPVNITAALTLGSETAVVRYNFVDSENDIVAIGKKYNMLSRATLADDARLMVPLRDSMEMFGLKVNWYQNEMCAEVYLPDKAETPENIGIVASYAWDGGSAHIDAPENSGGEDDEFLGVFKITHYCPCELCNGTANAHTAWAGELIPGQTIAVNPSVISPLTWVYIDGYGLRRAEDTGGGLDEYQIDVLVPDHETAMSLGVAYKDVYKVE